MISFHLSNIRMTSTKRHVYVVIYRCNRSMNVFASARPEPPEHDKKRELLVTFFQGFCFSKVFDTGSPPPGCEHIFVARSCCRDSLLEAGAGTFSAVHKMRPFKMAFVFKIQFTEASTLLQTHSQTQLIYYHGE